MTKNATTLISLSTLFCVGTLLVVLTSTRYELGKDSPIDIITNDKGRNERSTPRSFILPATPAVAIRQEQKLELQANELQIKHCMLKLYDLGYPIMSFEDIFDIHIFIALMDFQTRNLLPKTGELDMKTTELLGCDH